MNRVVASVLFLTLGWSSAAFAEGSCPPGYYPIGGGGASGCAPMPAGTSDLAASGPRWADRWGAISIDEMTASVGAVTGYPSKKQAEKAAIAKCRASGGGKGCGVSLSYYNQCAVIGTGARFSNTYGAATVEAASKLAMDDCNANTTNCRIYYSGCSLPERVR